MRFHACDLVLAKPSDAEKVAAATFPSKKFRSADIKGIETVKLGKLHAIVAKKKYEDVSGDYDLAASGGDEGPFVVAIPSELVTALAKFDASDVKRVVAAWLKTEEMKRDKWKSPDALRVVRAMCDFARTATKDKMALFLWMSL